MNNLKDCVWKPSVWAGRRKSRNLKYEFERVHVTCACSRAHEVMREAYLSLNAVLQSTLQPLKAGFIPKTSVLRASFTQHKANLGCFLQSFFNFEMDTQRMPVSRERLHSLSLGP